jgi:hypothetical protein
MSLPKNQAWFSAKRYGYGWGMPARWQGWAVLLAYVVAAALGAIYTAGAWQSGQGSIIFVGYMFALSSLLVAVCYWKGEPPRWRWGGNEEPPR